MGNGSQASEGKTGEAVQRALAQPPQSQREEVIVDIRGGLHHLQGPLPAWEPLGRNRKAAPWKVNRYLLFSFRMTFELGMKCFHVIIFIYRTDNAVKNHWNSTIKRKLEMGFFAGEVLRPNELEEILARVNKDVLVGCLLTMFSKISGNYLQVI